MGRVTGSFSRPIQGVSQQPAKVRLDGQCELSENFKPDVVQGLVSRPSTRLSAFVKDVFSQHADYKVHYYNRGDEESYFILISDIPDVKIFSPDGRSHKVVSESASTSYINTVDPSKELELVTIGDYTFITNTKRVVSKGGIKTPKLEHQAVVYVQFMDYAQTQSITIDGVEVAKNTSPDGSSSDHKANVATDRVASALYKGLVASLGDANWDLKLEVDCIYIKKKDNTDFNLSVSDSAGGDNLKGVKGFVSKITDLPPNAPEGMRVEVRPAGTTADSDSRYWLKASKADNSNNVIWEECLAPDHYVGVDASTMPQVLVRESIGLDGIATFSLKSADWQARDVGNDNNNPLPSFIGAPISNIGIFQNRLYVTSGESVTMTRTSNFFNFFRTTTQTVIDTDPIDVYADTKSVHALRASSALDGDIIFFSDSAQFRMSGRQPITAANAYLTQETQFQANVDAHPVASGDNLFFAFDYGAYVGIREFYTDNVTDTKRARPITEHVSRYVKGRVKNMASSTTVNSLVVQAHEDKNILYVYDWLWSGADKVQSAWGKWVFMKDAEVVSFVFDEQFLYILFRRGSDLSIERIDTGDPDDIGVDFPIRLDCLVKSTATLRDGKWRIKDSLPFLGTDKLIGVRAEGCYVEEVGLDFVVERDSAGLFTTDTLSDESTVSVYIGAPYLCKYIPSEPVIKDQYNKPYDIDKLMLGSIYMNYEMAGSFDVAVEGVYGLSKYSYNNRVLGREGNIVGLSGEVGGAYRIPIRQWSDSVRVLISTNSHRPLQVRDFEYEGNWSPRGTRR